MLAGFPQMLERAHKRKDDKNTGQVSLFAEEEILTVTDNFPDMEEFSKDELLIFEKSLLGFYLTHHPLMEKVDLLSKKVTHRINELILSRNPVVIGGMITQIKKIFTKASGAEMAFVKIDDFTGSVELVVFPSVYEKTRLIWINDRVILLKGKVSQKEDRLTVIVDDAKVLDLGNASS